MARAATEAQGSLCRSRSVRQPSRSHGHARCRAMQPPLQRMEFAAIASVSTVCVTKGVGDKVRPDATRTRHCRSRCGQLVSGYLRWRRKALRLGPMTCKKAPRVHNSTPCHRARHSTGPEASRVVCIDKRNTEPQEAVGRIPPRVRRRLPRVRRQTGDDGSPCVGTRGTRLLPCVWPAAVSQTVWCLSLALNRRHSPDTLCWRPHFGFFFITGSLGGGGGRSEGKRLPESVGGWSTLLAWRMRLVQPGVPPPLSTIVASRRPQCPSAFKGYKDGDRRG